MKTPALSFSLAILLAATAAAQKGPLVGEPAPPFSVGGCVNKPRIVESQELLGEVIVLEFWGIT